jgi:hypothetical protein
LPLFKFNLTERLLSDIAENAADMERPLSTPRSHVEEAGGAKRLNPAKSLVGRQGLEPVRFERRMQ